MEQRECFTDEEEINFYLFCKKLKLQKIRQNMDMSKSWAKDTVYGKMKLAQGWTMKVIKGLNRWAILAGKFSHHTLWRLILKAMLIFGNLIQVQERSIV